MNTSEKYHLVISPEAQEDIRGIVFYIARELSAPQAALRLADDFQKAIGTLSEMPERIKLLDESPWRDAGIRKLSVRNYYVYFWIDDATVSVKVLSVIYARREQSAEMKNRKMDQHRQ